MAENVESAAAKSFVPPSPVGSTYQKQSVQQELDRVEREKFWNEMREEEEARRSDEAARRRRQQELFAKEQRELADKLHKAHLEQQQTKQQQSHFAKSCSVDSSTTAGANKMGKLIAGRAQMFEQEMAKLAEPATALKPAKKPKNFKWQVNLLQNKGAVVGHPQHEQEKASERTVPNPPPKLFECAFVRKGMAKTAPEANGGPAEPTEPNANTKSAVPQIPVLPVPPVARHASSESIGTEEPKKKTSECSVTPPPSEPTAEPAKAIFEQIAPKNGAEGTLPSPATEAIPTDQQKQQNDERNSEDDGASVAALLRAKALWDYQAEDSGEISFDPDDEITDIEKVHDGWWYGRAPNGAKGLFPSNYVQLIQ